VIILEINRVPTGINGLDELIGGGFIERHNVVVLGGPGTGKTTFALQYIVNGARLYNERGIFVTTEQSIGDLIRDSMSLGWDLKALREEEMIKIINATPVPVSTESGRRLVVSDMHPFLGYISFNIDDVLSLIHETLRSFNAKRVAVDSLSHFIMYAEKDEKVRADLLKFITSIKKYATIVSTAELYGSLSVKSSMIPYLADGVIMLYLIHQGFTKIRACEIVKMRGTKHSMDVFRFEIKKGGIIIYPDKTVSISGYNNR